MKDDSDPLPHEQQSILRDWLDLLQVMCVSVCGLVVILGCLFLLEWLL